MTQEAKTLLDQIRQRSQQTNGGWMGFHPMVGPIQVGGRSPFDEMLELYLAARESEGLEKLRKEVEELKSKLKEAKQDASKRLNDQRTSERERDDALARREAEQKVLYQLVRVGDIICVAQEYYGDKKDKQRRKITKIDRDAKTVTYVNWDTRRKDWAKTEHTESLDHFALGPARYVLQVERPDDKENTKKRKSRAKSK